MFKKILVPLDGSKRAEEALSTAVALVEASRGEILLLRVPDATQTTTSLPHVDDYNWMRDSLDSTSEEVQAYLSFVQNKISHPHVCVRTKVVERDPASAITDTAVSENSDLICMSTHGRAGFSRWMLGSVTERVLSNAPCPVIVTRSTNPIQHILITLDGSALAEEAIIPGLEVAKALRSKVTLLRVQDKLTFSAAEASDYLKKCAAMPAMGDVLLETAVTSGPVAPQILEFASANQVDLIVMTTHGRTGLRRWLYGSITQKVLHGTPGALLIIRSDTSDLK